MAGLSRRAILAGMTAGMTAALLAGCGGGGGSPGHTDTKYPPQQSTVLVTGAAPAPHPLDTSTPVQPTQLDPP